MSKATLNKIEPAVPGKSDIAEPTSTGGAPKNFRTHPDIENFFRFIYENDLREEALIIMDDVTAQRAAKKAKKLAEG